MKNIILKMLVLSFLIGLTTGCTVRIIGTPTVYQSSERPYYSNRNYRRTRNNNYYRGRSNHRHELKFVRKLNNKIHKALYGHKHGNSHAHGSRNRRNRDGRHIIGNGRRDHHRY